MPFRNESLVFDLSKLRLGMFEDLCLELLHLLFHEFSFLLLPFFISDQHSSCIILIESIFSQGESFSLLLFFFLFGSDGLLDLLDLFITLLSGVFFYGNLLLLSDCSVPEFDVSHLFLLLLFDGLTFLHDEVLIDLNDDIIVDFCWVLFQILHRLSVLFGGSDFLETLCLHAGNEFESFVPLVFLKLFKDLHSGDVLLASDLLFVLQSLLSLDISNFLFLIEFSFLSFKVLESFLGLLHLGVFALLLLDFLLKLFLDLHEDTVSLGLAVSCGLGNKLESSVQLVTKTDESFGNLSLVVEAKEALVT